ncbi:hypothetical protein GCK72_013056 [Caenorhabditis remanei]|uniref:BED-type domain-containing protein n=1 Tax=Caenorhabditis remanei TaxID=31234 RepID=A0A6A5GPT9_CAERE|nr:hypothetical protein GCK72_013056 [Caenorhabditis remanei]KAF1756603.1 hypothetical protein GCK72_013056 [Caenorhabditis remanei]
MSNSSKRKRPSNHRSIVWKFYVYPTDGSSYVPCPKYPDTILTFNGSTTTNILYHLQSQHEDSYARLRGESIAESAGSSGNT